VKQLLLCAATVAVLTLPGAAMFLVYPRASATVPVIYVTPQTFDDALPRCTMRPLEHAV
jgi:hypothetical protein